MSKEIHCLAQGCTGIAKDTNAIFFLLHADICNIPKDRTVTYTWIVIDHHSQKEDPNRVCITVGGNLINYLSELTMQTANMVSFKILWNSVICTNNAHFAGADIINMYFKTPLDRYEYMKMPIALILTNIIKPFILCKEAINGYYVYMEIPKGMIGLP
jgi:hypothetical protein